MTILDEHERRVADALARQYKCPAPGPVIAEVAAIFGITEEALLGKSRRQDFADARAVVAFIMRERGWEHHEIAYLLRRERSTVHHMLSRMAHSWELRSMARDHVA
jgi:chromosomal replication initiation ATPase DnaA